MVQVSLGRRSRSTVLERGQVCCVDERRRSLVSRDAEGKFTSRGEKESDGCQSHDTAKTMAVSDLTVRSNTK